MVSYRCAFAIGGSSYKKSTLMLRRRPWWIFVATNLEREESKKNAFHKFCLSHEPTPQASSKKCVQALDTDNAALSASTVEYEFHPYVPRIE
jgi:hypothetical protein